jgi:hypothetical protein
MLNIITVYRFGSIDELDLTISSILAQSETEISVFFILSNASTEDIDWLNGRLCRRIEYSMIVNKDASLYNAMNIGLASVKEGGLFFLNGGDEFYDSESASLLAEYTGRECPVLFPTVQVYKDHKYLRLPNCDYPAHQGFFIERNLVETFEFNENLTIAADHYWMKRFIDFYGYESNDVIVSRFVLGGVSNYPSLKSIRARYRSQGFNRALREGLKYMLASILGGTLYYRLLLGPRMKDDVDSDDKYFS